MPILINFKVNRLGVITLFFFLFVFCFRAYNAVHHIFRSLLNAWKCSESMPVHFDTQYDQDHSQNILILLTTKSSAKAE